MKNNPSIAPTLFVVFTIFWLWLAIDPNYRDVWIAENIILIIGVSYLIFTYKQSPFSNHAYYLIFLFVILQTVGSHYTYAEVPLGFWVADWLNIERNHYDRLVHFAFGFLLVLPFKEWIAGSIEFKNHQWEVFTLVMLFIGMSGFYEILEWGYAVIFEQETQSADTFLGSQGDIWDAEKDVLLAGIGAWLYLLLFRKKTVK